MNKTNTLQSSNSNKLSNRVFFLLLVIAFAIRAFMFRNRFFNLDVKQWHVQELTMDYSYGFIRRGLLGTFASLIKNLFNIEYTTAFKAVLFIGFLLFTVSIFLFFHAVLKDENEKAFCFIALIFISLDFFGFELVLFGLQNTYIMAATLLMVYLIVKDKALFLIPFLAGICVCIHEAYPSMFFGVIVALLIYRFCYAGDKKVQQRYAVVFVLTGLIVSALFVYFYFINPRIKNADTEAIINSARAKLGSDFKTTNLLTIWTDPEPLYAAGKGTFRMWIDGKPTDLFYIYIMVPLLNLLVCSPLIAHVALFWRGIIKNEKAVFKKVLLLFCSLSVFLTLPLIIFHLDQGRWFYDVVFFEIVTIGGIFLINANNERKVLSKLTNIGIIKLLLLLFYAVVFFQLVPDQICFVSIFYVKLIL